jgi:SAM-dependent methyltransferase
VSVQIRARWEAAAQLLARHRDVLEGRPGERDAPAALVARGWAPYLLTLDDAALEALEVDGYDASWPGVAPASLVALAAEARAVCAIPALGSPSGSALSAIASARGSALPGTARRRETPRKRAQIDAFARLVLPLSAHATRVVDVGSGHGHLTRDIAERIAVPVVGLERDAALADRARTLSPSASVEFAVTDVLHDGLVFSPGDCVIALHACGELGDATVESVARCGASLALVGCCLQKRRASSRHPLCAMGAFGEALDLPKSVLGLSNLTARDDGVEATRSENLAARERRLALHRLLTAALGELRFGAEIEGVNRRAAQRDLASLVARAFAVRRLPAPPAAAVDEAARWAALQHARTRRLSLPRAMLARALEVFVLLDRARYLEERGLEVAVGPIFPASVSARNLAVIARLRPVPIGA